jgi:hypothetical protein
MRIWWAAGLLLMFVPSLAFAQNGRIAGAVRDATGAVLPGVTVEASSAALIEKTRTVVTDAAGQYDIVDLRPGTYVVTFTLAGFTAVRREDVNLAAGFTASINVEMRVGSVEETITVTGASPIVDVQTISKRTTIAREVIDTLPTTKHWAALGKSTLVGVTKVELAGDADVGGTAGEAAPDIRVHGSGRSNIQINGMNRQSTFGNTGLMVNDGQIEDIVFESSSISVEVPTGGIRANIIPKEGGNRFSGSLFGNFANDGMQGDNLTPELAARGTPAVSKIDILWDQSANLGGPIKKDNLWFFFSQRYWGRHRILGDIYYSHDPDSVVYNPDLTRPANQKSYDLDGNVRLTWQASPRNKFAVFYDQHPRCHCTFLLANNIAAEAGRARGEPRAYAAQGQWNSPITSRLLAEVVTQWHAETPTDVSSQGLEDREPIYAVREVSTQRTMRSPGFTPYWIHPTDNSQTRASLNYVTGSHSLKAGFSFLWAHRKPTFYTRTNDTSLQVLNGRPQSIVVYSTPYTQSETLNSGVGIFLQERWTAKRLTLDAGLRFDYLNWQVDAQSTPGGYWAGPRSYGPVPDVPNWKDLSPRVGVAYDLFGNGRTALKASVSRYLDFDMTPAIVADSNPINASVNSATRTWSDDNGDFIPQEGELGPLSNSSFGQVVIRTRYDDSVRSGWYKRPSDWEYTTTLQQQLGQNVSAEVGYFRRSNRNFTAADNLSVTPADYDPYCIVAPLDPRLPGGGGYQVCGLYDVKPDKFGQVNNLVVFNPDQTRQYDGVDLSVTMRSRGVVVYGGVNFGRLLEENCTVVDSPQLQFCGTSTGIHPIGNLSVSYPLPWWRITTSAVFQSNPGPIVTAAYAAPNSIIAPSLGRNLSAGPNATATVQLVEPGTMYGDRWNEVDFRVSKAFSVQTGEFQIIMDLYNVFNANPVVTQNNAFGSNWQRPQTILPARFVKVGAQFKF